MSLPYAEVIGDPIAQSKSPAIHGFWLQTLDIKANYQATRVHPGELGEFLTTRRTDPAWRGCNVTMPHKQAVMPFLDRLDPLAAAVGAVNTIIPEDGQLVGYNTDVPGFLEPLRSELAKTHYFRMARVIGTGGAARAIIKGLADEKLVIVLAGRNPDKARALLDELDPAGEHHAIDLAHFAEATDFAFDDRAGCFDLVVNASSLGMTGQPPLTLDLAPLPEDAIVYDLVYAPLETSLLQAAEARGLEAIDGLDMLIGQAALAFELFFGAAPPRERDEDVRALLGA